MREYRRRPENVKRMREYERMRYHRRKEKGNEEKGNTGRD